MEPELHVEEHNEPSTALKIGVLIGLIALLIIGILLPIKLVPNAFSTIGTKVSSFFSSHERVILSTDPSTITSGQPFTLKWSGPHRTDGTYILSYSCADGIHLETSVNQPNETINCNTQYYFTPSDNSIVLTPYSATQTLGMVSINLSFLQNGASLPESVSDLYITISNLTPEGIATTSSPHIITTSHSPATTTVISQQSSTSTLSSASTAASSQPSSYHSTHILNPHGTADLAVTITSIGYSDPITQHFVPSKTVASTARVVVKFTISNIGTKNTGSWNFIATLPSSSEPTYTSALQQNLNPGDHIAYTLSFDGLTATPLNTITITADPNNVIPEISQSNNTARTTISTTDTYPYGNTYGYSNGQSDLSVRILSTGRINAATGQYYPTTSYQYSSINYGDQAAVQFVVQNNGGSPTGQWRFSANLPNQAPQYISSYQPSLNPGESRIVTIGFNNYTNAYMGNQVLSITVDPYHETTDTDLGNNTATTQVY